MLCTLCRVCCRDQTSFFVADCTVASALFTGAMNAQPWTCEHFRIAGLFAFSYAERTGEVLVLDIVYAFGRTSLSCRVLRSHSFSIIFIFRSCSLILSLPLALPVSLSSFLSLPVSLALFLLSQYYRAVLVREAPTVGSLDSSDMLQQLRLAFI